MVLRVAWHNKINPIETIETLPLFIDDKVRIALVHQGVKPASFVDVYHTSVSPLILKETLSRFEIHCKIQERKFIKNNRQALCILALYFARDQHTLTGLLKTTTDTEFGHDFGFPTTAIDVYQCTPQKYEGNVPDHIERDTITFAQYILSNEYWQQELQTAQRWRDTIKRSSSHLYKKFLETKTI